MLLSTVKLQAKKVNKFYFKAEAKYIPPNTVIYKDPPDQRARKLAKPYTITNKIVFYSDEKNEIAQESTKMLYLIDEKGKISFLHPDYLVSVGFDSIEEVEEFIVKVKQHANDKRRKTSL
jgi:hypothetical protein